MIRKLRIAAMLLPLVCVGALSFGQQRYCDLNVTLLSPQNGTVIAPYETFIIKVNIENLGPDSLLVGDTLYYNLPVDLLASFRSFVVPQNVPPNSAAMFTLDSIVNVNDNPEDETVDFCVRVKSDPPGSQQMYVDTIESNNYACNNVTIRATTGIDDLSKEDLFSIQPNPVSGSVLHVSWKSQSGKMPEKCIIWGMDGRVVSVYQPKGNVQQMAIPVSSLASGVYFLEIQAGKQRDVQKFVKQ